MTNFFPKIKRVEIDYKCFNSSIVNRFLQVKFSTYLLINSLVNTKIKNKIYSKMFYYLNVFVGFIISENWIHNKVKNGVMFVFIKIF